jgi:hypothetical protein
MPTAILLLKIEMDEMVVVFEIGDWKLLVEGRDGEIPSHHIVGLVETIASVRETRSF